MHWFKKFYRALTRKEKIYFSAAAGAAALACLGFLAAFYITNTESVPAAAGIYHEAMPGQPAYVNPVIAKSAVDKSLSTLIFAALPDLADVIETASDGNSVRVHLKDNLRWSDGAEITSDDVIFTVDVIQNPDAASPLASAWQGVRADRVSKLEVNFTLPSAYAFFDETLADLRPIPKHLFAEIPPVNWRLSEYNLRPVGSGPYIFASRAIGPDGFVNSYRLKANPRFPAGTPFIQILEFSFARNRTDLFKAFNSGQVEGIFLSDATEKQEIQRPYREIKFTNPTYYAVFWNQSANSALASEEVRQALALAIDREQIIREALGGEGFKATDPLSPAFLPPVAAGTSTASADSLLTDAGFTRNDSGLWAKQSRKTTTELAFTLLVPDVPFLVKTAQILKANWERMGARVNVEVSPLEQILEGQIKNRTYEALLFGNTPTLNGDLFSFWHSTERLYPGLNLALYQSKKADQLIEKIRTEKDAAKRRQDMENLRTEIIADEPALFLFSPTALYATGKNIRGIEPMPITDAADRFRGINKWYVETKRIWKD